MGSDNDTFCHIFWSDVVAEGLDTAYPYCVALYFHRLYVKQIGTGGVGVYMLEYFVIGWPSLWVAKRRSPLMIFFVTTKPLLC